VIRPAAPSPGPLRAARGAVLLAGLAALALLQAGCGRHGDRPGARTPAYAGKSPRAVVVNASRFALGDVTLVGGRGPLAPALDRLAPGDSAGFTLEVRGEDAVFASFVAGGRACVSVDSAYVEGGGGYEVRFLVDSTLTARVAGPVTIRP
jgi:hypothetical protein